MDRKLNLLSLDGGGVRGLSSLYILKQIMESIDPVNPPKPCKYFDMIAGTSTGGLIAIMLGRLKMSVQECINVYHEFSLEAFTRKRWIPVSIRGNVKERFDSKRLKMALRKVLVKYGVGEEALLRDSDLSCRVFVCATHESNTITTLKSYPSPHDNQFYNTLRIWEAGRATSAATSFFDPITISVPKKQSFIDGATGANNPIRYLWMEARDIWTSPPSRSRPRPPFENQINCIISIGTGVPPPPKSRNNNDSNALDMLVTLKRIAVDTEVTAREFEAEHPDLVASKRYFRFSVPEGLKEIGLEEVDKMGAIADVTREYMGKGVVREQVKMCARVLQG